MGMVNAANAALMERSRFADDAIEDDLDEDEELGIADNDDHVMDEVDAFLEAHDSGLTEADKKVAQGLFFSLVGCLTRKLMLVF